MPITLDGLQKDLRSCSVIYNEESMTITYRPSLYTPFVEHEMQSAFKDKETGESLAILVCEIVESWELLDEERNVIPIESDSVRGLPIMFLSAIVSSISADLAVSREEIKNLEGGSRAKKRSAYARHGTR